VDFAAASTVASAPRDTLRKSGLFGKKAELVSASGNALPEKLMRFAPGQERATYDPRTAVGRSITKAVPDVKTPEEAFARARAIESSGAGSARDRAVRALPYYGRAARPRKPGARRPKCAATAARRVGEIVEDHGGKGDLKVAMCYYMLAEKLQPGCGAWRRVSGIAVKIGWRRVCADWLETLAKSAEKRREHELAAEIRREVKKLRDSLAALEAR